jgi:hypothetical protein
MMAERKTTKYFFRPDHVQGCLTNIRKHVFENLSLALRPMEVVEAVVGRL